MVNSSINYPAQPPVLASHVTQQSTQHHIGLLLPLLQHLAPSRHTHRPKIKCLRTQEQVQIILGKVSARGIVVEPTVARSEHKPDDSTTVDLPQLPVKPSQSATAKRPTKLPCKLANSVQARSSLPHIFTAPLTALRSKRETQLPQKYSDCVVETTTGSSGKRDCSLTNQQKYTQLYFEIIDNCVGELEARFNERNTALALSVKCLWPGCKEDRNATFLSSHELSSLGNLIDIDVTSASVINQCSVAAEFIVAHINKCSETTAPKNLSDIMQLLLPVKAAFPAVYSLYAAALTLGMSTASCEASFSTLARVLTPYRRSMTHNRKSNLVLLSFQEHYTQAINLDEFIVEFSKKSRKLQVC
jgi:hypothetical protein